MLSVAKQKMVDNESLFGIKIQIMNSGKFICVLFIPRIVYRDKKKGSCSVLYVINEF